MAPIARADSLDLEPKSDGGESGGLDYSFHQPPLLDDVRVYDKSMPLPEVFRKLHEGAVFYYGSSPFDDDDTVFPLPINRDVQTWIDYYTGRGRGGFETWMARGGKYEHIILPELRKRNMPEELFYLCMIESGFSPRVGSWAGAKGLWQFIHSTGQRYGLRIDYWVDERYDPEKATHAALDYLSFLYDRYHDWHLAAAAYNTGEGNVDRAIQRTQCNDYWEICAQRGVVAETRGYVPKMVAAAIVGKHPEAYGFYNINKQAPFRYSTVTIDKPIDLQVAARCAGVSGSELERLNPELLRYCTPPDRPYKLHVPTTQLAEFKSAYAALGSTEKTAFKTHVVGKGENFRSIARGYGISSKMLASANSRSIDATLSEGTELLVPVPPEREYNPSRQPLPDEERPRPPRTPSPSAGSTRKKKTYTVEPGDTLETISIATGISISRLKRYNSIKDADSIQEGDVLVLYGESRSQPTVHRKTSKTKTINYTVRQGDTCYMLARYYGIKSSDIREQNHLGSSCTLKPGQKITLTVPSKAPSRLPPSARGDDDDDDRRSTTKGKATTYTVKKGDTIGGIAKKYGVTTSQIKEWNRLKSNSLKAGQKLIVKKPKSGSSTTSSTASAPRKGKKTVHTVKAGESLWTIARNYDVRVADIKAWNNLETEAVKPGKKLTVYPGSSAGATSKPSTSSTTKPKSSTSSNSSTTTKPGGSTKGKKKITYTVKNGDSLWSIARAHDVHLAEIKQWNKMSSDAVKPGQKLVIYVD